MQQQPALLAWPVPRPALQLRAHAPAILTPRSPSNFWPSIPKFSHQRSKSRHQYITSLYCRRPYPKKHQRHGDPSAQRSDGTGVIRRHGSTTAGWLAASDTVRRTERKTGGPLETIPISGNLKFAQTTPIYGWRYHQPKSSCMFKQQKSKCLCCLVGRMGLANS